MKPSRFAPLRAFTCMLAACVSAAFVHAQTGPALQWRPLCEPGVGGWVTGLSYNPGNPSQVIASGDILGLARSINGGRSWSRSTPPTGSYMMEEVTWHPQANNSASSHYGEVWAASMAGPWKSTDFGKTWTYKRTGMPQPVWATNDFRPAIQKILVDPLVPSRLLAFFGTHRLVNTNGTYVDSGKVYVSTDDGENWSALATIVSDSANSRARLITAAAYRGSGAGANTTIYVASRKGFHKSTDNGVGWTQKSAGLPGPDRNIRALAVHPTNGAILWISVDDAGIYKSTDAGETWTAANNGIASPTYASLDALVVSPAAGNILFTSDINAKRLYRSIDGGASWVLQPSPAFGNSPHPVYRDVHCFAAHPTAPGVFLAGTPTDIWQISNATAADDLDGIAPYTGPLWTNVSSVPRASGWAGTGFSGLVAHQFRWNPYNANEAAIAAMDAGKFVSRDGLQSWTFAGGGPGKGVYDWFAFVDFSFSAVSGHWWALQGQHGNQNALLRTTTAGAAWSTIARPSVDGVAASGYPGRVHTHRSDSARVWVVWGDKLYYSATAGSAGSWVQLAQTAGNIYELTADPTDPSGLRLWIGSSVGLFRTTDGQNFTQIAPNSASSSITRVRLDPTNPARIWTVNAKRESINTWDTGLWRLTLSAPGATTGTWSSLASWGNPASPVRYIVDVAVDPTNGNRIVASTSMDNFTSLTFETGVWVNDNNGASNAWRREVAGLGVQRVRTVAFRPGTSELVAGTMGGGYYIADTDGGIIDLNPVPDVFELPASSADAESRRIGSGDGGGTVENTAAGELFIGNANNGGSASSPVYAFRLPDLGAVSAPFTSATFSVALSTSASNWTGYRVDVYGLAARSEPTVLGSDAFAGANDTTGAVKLQDNWVDLDQATPVPIGVRSLSNAALVSYLNNQYSGGAGAGRYVFLRLSPDTGGNTWKNVRFAASEYSGVPDWLPRLVIE